MKNNCTFLNFCDNPHLCCAFCTKEDCPDRCKDDHEHCKWLTNKLREPTGKFEKIEPKEPKKRNPKDFEIPQKINKKLKKKK